MLGFSPIGTSPLSYFLSANISSILSITFTVENELSLPEISSLFNVNFLPDSALIGLGLIDSDLLFEFDSDNNLTGLGYISSEIDFEFLSDFILSGQGRVSSNIAFQFVSDLEISGLGYTSNTLTVDFNLNSKITRNHLSVSSGSSSVPIYNTTSGPGQGILYIDTTGNSSRIIYNVSSS